LRIVYSDIDPHKKGFLSENDWILAFGILNNFFIIFIKFMFIFINFEDGYNWKKQMLLEVQ
jgi:hypothetical protein